MVISVSDVLRFTAPTHTEHVVAESATTRKDALQVTEQVTVLSNYPVNVTLTPVSAGVFAHYVPADDDAQTDLAVEVPFSDAPSPTDQPATARPYYVAPATSDADKANVLILTAVAR